MVEQAIGKKEIMEARLEIGWRSRVISAFTMEKKQGVS
jgi:hypothetical protein